MKRTTQKRKILRYLKTHSGITAADAVRLFRCWRLAARIYDLKKDGYEIKTVMIKNYNFSYAKYILEVTK